MSQNCGCWVDYYGEKACGAAPTHAVVCDGDVIGLLCRSHSREDCRDAHLRRGFIQKIHHDAMNASGDWRVEPTVESLHCEACKQRLPIDKYPGRKCPECQRAAMIADATDRQTAAMTSLHRTIEEFKERQIMATNQTPAASPGIIDRTVSAATAIGLDDMTLRMTARQIRKLAKAPLTAGLAARLKVAKPREFTRAVTAFLNSDLGDAALSVVLGGIVRYAPFVPEKYRESLSRELVVDGGAAVLDFAADIVMGPVRDALSGASSLLADPNVASALRDGGIKVESVATVGAEVAR